MPKSLMCGHHGVTLGSGEELTPGSVLHVTNEAQTQWAVTEGATFSAMRGRVISGNSDPTGTANFRVRINATNGTVVGVATGATLFEDATNSDAFAAGDLQNIAYTDNGTDSVVGPIGLTVEFASGHGAFHTASLGAVQVYDVGSATRYIPIHGASLADGVTAANIARVQMEVYEYTTVEAIQIRVTANARVNDSVISLNVNGTDVGTPITFATTVTGLQSVTAMAAALSPGDLVCLSVVLLAGVEDLTVAFSGATLKSTSNGSEAGMLSSNGQARAASATPTYYTLGHQASTIEANAAFKIGFACRVKNLRIFLSANTYSTDATLTVFIDGSATAVTKTITAAATGFIRELTLNVDCPNGTETISLEIVGGTTGSITIHQIMVSLAEIPAGGAQTIDADPAGETEAAQVIGHAKARTIGIASETETAIAITHSKARTIGIASEIEAALRIAMPQTITVGVASEIEDAGAITPSLAGGAFLAAAQNRLRIGIGIGF